MHKMSSTKKPSTVWHHFVKTDDGGKCKLCKSIVKTKGNTTNLKNHLNRKHPEIMPEPCQRSAPKRPAAVEVNLNSDDENLDDPQSPESQEANHANQPMSAGSSTSSVSVESSKVQRRTPQIRLDDAFAAQKSFEDGGAKAGRVTNAMLFMICKDNLPLNTVEKEGFKLFMKTVAPLYKIPARKTTTTLIEDKFKILSEEVKAELRTTDNFSITTDVWTDTLNARSFLGVTAHFVAGGSLKSVLLAVTELDDRHTASNLGGWLLDTLDQWNIPIEKVVAVISDNASNITKAITEIFGVERHLPCFAHTLNLVASKVIETDQTLNPLCGKVKSIVTYFKHSVVAADQLRKQSNLKLIQSVPTRWNSTYYMLERFVQLAHQVGLILLQCPAAPEMLTASELQIVKEAIQLLKPFETATKIVCGEYYLTGSKVIPIVDTMKTGLGSLDVVTASGKRIQKALVDNFSQRFERVERVNLLATSTILDPRFKKLHFSDKVACSHTVNRITRMLNSAEEAVSIVEARPLQSTPDDSDFWSHHKVLENLAKSRQSEQRNEVPDAFRNYLSQPTLAMNVQPIKYWSTGYSVDCSLNKLAQKYLAVVATSVPSERLFSKAGNIMTEARNRLSGDHLY